MNEEIIKKHIIMNNSNDNIGTLVNDSARFLNNKSDLNFSMEKYQKMN